MPVKLKGCSLVHTDLNEVSREPYENAPALLPDKQVNSVNLYPPPKWLLSVYSSF